MTAIHATAVVSSAISEQVAVGPYAVIDPHVRIGAHSLIDSHARVYAHTTLGEFCVVGQGAAVGNVPQDLKFVGEHSELIVGHHTTIREYATLNRGTQARGQTLVGNHCLLMAYVHVGHDSRIGDHVVLANNVTLGGEVDIEDHAGVGGMVPIHQFCRIGRHAFVGGGFRVVQDVPPFVLAAGEPLRFSGLNYVGLRRHEFTAERIRKLEGIYHIVYREGLNRSTALSRVEAKCEPSEDRETILSFFRQSKRGVIR